MEEEEWTKGVDGDKKKTSATICEEKGRENSLYIGQYLYITGDK